MSWERRWHQSSVAGLYIHLPFCARKCAYCDFASWETDYDDPLMRNYALAICSELDEAASVGLLDSIDTAYLGGGTPTMLSASLPLLVAHIAELSGELSEFTSEANPDSLSPSLTVELKQAGLTRISIGVQSTSDEELKLLGRLHDGRGAETCMRTAVNCGFDVSCDLMCAIPAQSSVSFQHSLVELLSCSPAHISIYPLQIEEGTPLASTSGKNPPWNSEDTQADRMEQAYDLLTKAGFTRYEVASYARPSKSCAHNIAYWTGLPYLGLGTAAAGMLTREAYMCLARVSPQLPPAPSSGFRVRTRVLDGRKATAAHRRLSDLSYELEWLSAQQAAAEDLMLGARLSTGLGPALIEAAAAVIGDHIVDERLESLVEEGLLKKESDTYVPTKRGWLVGNELFGKLWDLAGDQHTITLEVRP